MPKHVGGLPHVCILLSHYGAVDTHTYAHTHTHTHTHTHIYIYIYMCVCVCVYGDTGNEVTSESISRYIRKNPHYSI